LGLFLSCRDGPDDETKDRYRKLVDITRDEAALKEYLKPIPPTEPADAIKTFETAGGFRMELVAHEPLFTEPAGATFDEDGRVYVAEIVGYLYQPGSGPRGSCANVAFYPRAGFEALWLRDSRCTSGSPSELSSDFDPVGRWGSRRVGLSTGMP